MPRAKQLSVEEQLARFAGQLQKVSHAPNINRYEPMPHQELFMQSQIRNRILFGGNRGGKTYGSCADDVLVLLRKHPYRQHMYADRPLRLRFIGVDFERGIDQTALPIYSQMIPPSKLINGSWEDSYRPAAHMLYLADESSVSFMAYTQLPKQFQSVSLDHTHFDEEPPEAIFKESIVRMLDTNGTWTLSETPVEQMEWVYDELVEPSESGLRPDIETFYLDTRENVHLSPEALTEILGQYSEEELIIRAAGQYNTAGSLVFPEFTRKAPNVIPGEIVNTLKLADRDEWRIYASMDHGYMSPSAWLWTAVHRTGAIIPVRGLYHAKVTVGEWAKLVLATEREMADTFGLGRDWAPEFRCGDPAISQKNGITGTSVQQEYSLGGVAIGTEGIVNTRSGNQNVGLDKIHTYLRQRPPTAPPSVLDGKMLSPWLQIPDYLTFFIDELKKARKPKQTLQQAAIKNASEEIRDKDNHAIDAFKYLLIMTHELRPEQYRIEDERFKQLMGSQFQPRPLAAVTTRDIVDTTMATDSDWQVYDADDYRRNEY